MKRFLTLLCFIFLCSFVILGGQNLQAAQRVYDFAQLFTEDEEITLENELSTIRNEEQMDVGIVTTNDAEGKTSPDYADDFYDRYELGYGSTRDGLLLLLDMDNREVYISTCGQAISIFNDARIEKMLRAIVGEMKEKDYEQAALTFIKGCRSYLKAGVPDQKVPSKPIEKEKTPLIEALSIALGIAAAVTLIVRFSVIHHYKKPSRSLPPMLPQNVHYLERSDRFVTSHTTRVPIPKDDHHNNSGGGFGGGGSSTHTSSSGTTHGGGGIGF